MTWITRERVKVDRVACPWLIRKFIDSQAEFLFVPGDQVESKGCELGATPYDIDGCELGHHDDIPGPDRAPTARLNCKPTEAQT